MALPTSSRLLYPDVNTTPWPFNHHAYVHACVERLAKEVRHRPLVRFSESQFQREDIRGALVRLEATEETPAFCCPGMSGGVGPGSVTVDTVPWFSAASRC